MCSCWWIKTPNVYSWSPTMCQATSRTTKFSLGIIAFHLSTPSLRPVLVFFTFLTWRVDTHGGWVRHLMSSNPLSPSDSGPCDLNHFVRTAVFHVSFSCIPPTAPSISWPESWLASHCRSGEVLIPNAGIQDRFHSRVLHCLVPGDTIPIICVVSGVSWSCT